ncbi:SPASM domain peptide maturase, grasp-with-spasm system [Mucilaginibacter gossypiicola]|uniref:SPASM domain peptide maturase, grasp-with-spasm system n=1 Tax=Mucilaginibacter gossypiicola TaxID=551995 RepID=A0A1H8TME7_9SPHI|nr:hypothetical protein [Mucilaginibacter gossypiicola]SEO91638.1 SPASM domain peptide maturase, grasp-with-spasm system [Mucilaginibacter gossypiicola]
MSKHLILHAHCIPVRGKEQGAIYDLQKGSLMFIPNSMIDLIEYMRDESYHKTRKVVNSLAFFKEHVDFILSNGLGFFTDHPQRFIALPDQYHSPEEISTAVIEYGADKFDLKSVINELNMLRCKHIEFRYIDCNPDFSELRTLIGYTNNSTIRSIELHLTQNEKISKVNLLGLAGEFKKLRTINVHNSASADYDFKNNIFFLESDWKTVEQKHFPHDVYIVNMKFFMESQKFNTFYNQKVCISRDGYIKNSLLNVRHFGQYSTNNTLTDVVRTDEFKKLWFISPDMIEEVKESETRYATLFSQDVELIDGKYHLIH